MRFIGVLGFTETMEGRHEIVFEAPSQRDAKDVLEELLDTKEFVLGPDAVGAEFTGGEGGSRVIEVRVAPSGCELTPERDYRRAETFVSIADVRNCLNSKRVYWTDLQIDNFLSAHVDQISYEMQVAGLDAIERLLTEDLADGKDYSEEEEDVVSTDTLDE